MWWPSNWCATPIILYLFFKDIIIICYFVFQHLWIFLYNIGSENQNQEHIMYKSAKVPWSADDNMYLYLFTVAPYLLLYVVALLLVCHPHILYLFIEDIIIICTLALYQFDFMSQIYFNRSFNPSVCISKLEIHTFYMSFDISNQICSHHP